MKRIKTIYFISVIIFFALFNQECYSQNTKLLAGIAKVDITPTENLYMGGYDESCRIGRSDGADGKIYIRALMFDDHTRKIVFVECDIVSISSEENESLRKLISKETDIPFENVMLGCVHNHAAPSFDKQNSDSKWYKSFNNNVVKVVKDAIADMEPVKIGGGIGKSSIGMNRRKKMEDTLSYATFDENNSSQSYGKFKTDNPVKIREMSGVCRLGVNPGGDIDDEVGIMRIDKLTGEPKAVFVSYACHGTSLGGRNNKISPEWNGNMLEYIEKSIPGVKGIFAQGAAGDINPRFVGGLDGYKDNLENTAKLGYEIGREVVDIYSKIKTDSPIDPEIKIIHENIVCPLRYGEVVKDFRHTTVDVPTSVIRIDDFEWVTFPGELFHKIGQVIKSSTHARYPFLVGYCNGSLGYLPTQQAYSEGGYEPWSSRFDPVTEKIYEKGIERILNELH
jgi:neutral ceramidase